MVGPISMEAALPDELVEEVLFRIPPDDPDDVIRTALVCKRWHRLVADPGFRLRLRGFHRAAPLLGVLCNFIAGAGGTEISRFLPTSSFRPPHADHCDMGALDVRPGRVLLYHLPRGVYYDGLASIGSVPCGADLVVWDPITDERRELPRALLFDGQGWNVAVLCAAHGACDHLDCHRGPFLVVFAGVKHRESVYVCLYSSDAHAWSEPTYVAQCQLGVDMEPSTALVGNALYFLVEMGRGILKYNLATRETHVIHLPSESSGLFAVLTTTEDGVLGLAATRSWEICRF